MLAVLERLDNRRVELRPLLRDDLTATVAPAAGGAVGAVVRDRVERVGDGEDPRAERDLLGEPVGIAGAVPALVMGADDLNAGLVQEGDAADHLPRGVCAFITRHSASFSSTGLSRIWSGTPILPMSWRRNPPRCGIRGELRVIARASRRVPLDALGVLARAGVLRPRRARRCRHRLLAQALSSSPRCALDLDEVTQGRGRRGRAAPRPSGRYCGASAPHADPRQALDDAEQLEWPERLQQQRPRPRRRPRPPRLPSR